MRRYRIRENKWHFDLYGEGKFEVMFTDALWPFGWPFGGWQELFANHQDYPTLEAARAALAKEVAEVAARKKQAKKLAPVYHKA